MRRLVVISSFPPRGKTHHKSVIGGASYTKNTLIALRKEAALRDTPVHITVLAQKIAGEPTTSEDEGITVKRLWKRNSLSTFNNLYKEISANHKQTKDILIELELNIFGNSSVFLGLLIPFLLALKTMGKNVTLVIHEVIYDMGKFGPHINVKEKSIKTTFLNFGLGNFYRTLLLSVNRAIVFEESLKSRLSDITGKHNKITVIPIAVENLPQRNSKANARKELGIAEKDFVVMTFGFLAWYKGTDWLANAWPELEVSKEIKVPKVSNAKKPFDTSDTSSPFDTFRLIIAGGPNPNRIELPYYKKYLKDLSIVANEKDITLTGFVPEERMHLYFEASDVVVFPYRTMMSSSAVLSLAFSYELPFLLSENMRPVFASPDIREELLSSNLTESDVLFPLDNTFMEKLEKLKKTPEKLEKMTQFSKKMKEKRSWELISKKYYETIF